MFNKRYKNHLFEYIHYSYKCKICGVQGFYNKDDYSSDGHYLWFAFKDRTFLTCEEVLIKNILE